MNIHEAARLCDQILAGVERAMVGKKRELRTVFAAILAGGTT